jgi:hypothetical protein
MRLPDLQHTDGSPVSLSEWNISQLGLVLEFTEESRLTPAQAVQFWASHFAAGAREICRCDGLERFLEKMKPFQSEVAKDIAKRRWLLSERAGYDVGSEPALAGITSTVSCLVEEGKQAVVLVVSIPYVPQNALPVEPPKAHQETLKVEDHMPVMSGGMMAAA